MDVDTLGGCVEEQFIWKEEGYCKVKFQPEQRMQTNWFQMEGGGIQSCVSAAAGFISDEQ